MIIATFVTSQNSQKKKTLCGPATGETARKFPSCRSSFIPSFLFLFISLYTSSRSQQIRFPQSVRHARVFSVHFFNKKLMDACVDSGCTHPIDGLFWSLPICLLGFFSKYECWVTDLIMPLYHDNFFGLSLAFLYNEVSHYYEMSKKNSYD
jgi:hypothetical protein